MTERPYVLLSCAMSVDGCLDGTGRDRLVLSGDADLDRVDAERASCDAIMVGAGTIRRDNPRLLIRSAERRAGRTARGQPAHPAGVTITASGDLDPAASFFTAAAAVAAGDGDGDGDGGSGEAGRPGGGGGSPDRAAGAGRAAGADRAFEARRAAEAARLVYAAAPAARRLGDLLNGRAEVIDAGDSPQLAAILADLAGRGVRRLMVEGGASLGSQFLTAGLVDELQLVIAPFFVGDAAAPRFAGPGRYPWGPASPLRLAEARQVGGVALLRLLARGDDPPDLPGRLARDTALPRERPPDPDGARPEEPPADPDHEGCDD